MANTTSLRFRFVVSGFLLSNVIPRPIIAPKIKERIKEFLYPIFLPAPIFFAMKYESITRINKPAETNNKIYWLVVIKENPNC